MKYYSFILTLVLVSLFQVSSGFGQSNKEKYTKDFEFNPGIFVSIYNVQQNNATPFEKVTLKNGRGLDLNQLRTSPKNYFDQKVDMNLGVSAKLVMQVGHFWGFSDGKNIYINLKKALGSRYNKIESSLDIYNGPDIVKLSSIGSISYLTTFVDMDSSSTTNVESKNTVSPVIDPETKEYILLLKTGKLLDYNVEGMKIALSSDLELLERFEKAIAITKEEDLKRLLVDYSSEFNEIHPLYFPN